MTRSVAMSNDQRTARAVAAATAAGRDLGFEATDPKVLHDMFSVVVHLSPAPVVVRVPVLLPPSLRGASEAQALRQRDELAVTSWLAGTGFPVVPPLGGPVERDGFLMTFWQWVQTVDTEPDFVAQTADTTRLHAALRAYPGDLPFMPSMDQLDEQFAILADHPDLLAPEDLARARSEWEELRPLLTDRSAFESAFPDVPVQAVHGDSPSWNVLNTAEGLLYSDFELVGLGPVEWDLALLPPDFVAAYNARARELGMRETSAEVQRVMDAGRMLQVVACLALVPELPMLRDGLAPLVDQWRSR